MKTILALAALLLLAAPAYAANEPLDVHADRLEVNQKTGHAVFIGHVHATRGNFTLDANQTDIEYESGKKGQIKQIIATGSVVLSQAGTPPSVAHGERGVYTPATGKLVLTGGTVLLTRDGQTLKGNQLVYDTATGQATLTGGAGVQGHFENTGQ